MSQITIHADSKDPKSIAHTIMVLTLLQGKTPTTKAAAAPAKGKGKKEVEEEEFVDESEISTFQEEEFEEEPAEEEEMGEFDEPEEEEKPKKGSKAAAPAAGGKIKVDQLIKGFQKLVERTGSNAAAKKILDKYKVKSVRDLKEKDYAAILTLLKK